jgi:hypothetical protein
MDVERIIDDIEQLQKCSKCRILGHSARATSRPRIKARRQCSRKAHGFAFGSGTGFAAEVNPKAGFEFRASAAFPVLKPIAMLNFRAGVASAEVQRVRGALFRQSAQVPDNGGMRNRATQSVALLLMLLTLPCAAQNTDYNKEAVLDEKGNIFVSSDAGRLIWMADTLHCSESIFAPDGQTVGCLVAPPTDVFPPAPSLKLEIYLKGGEKRTIEPGAAILDWHFWEEGRAVAAHSGLHVRQGTYTLYESATARVIEKLAEPADERTLPPWAKSQAQIQDEAVPMSVALTQERTYWIAKVLRQIKKIEPGMRRKDLVGIFTTEGGLSNRFQRTYVHVDCPYIKVNVRFKAASGETNALKEDPDDIIEFVSQPFLQWSTMD